MQSRPKKQIKVKEDVNKTLYEAVQQAKMQLQEAEEEWQSHISREVAVECAQVVEDVQPMVQVIGDIFKYHLLECHIHKHDDTERRLFTMIFEDALDCVWSRGGIISDFIQQSVFTSDNVSWPASEDANEFLDNYIRLLTFTFVKKFHQRLTKEGVTGLVSLETIRINVMAME